MGRFPAESDVDIMDEKGALITSPDDRHRYRMEGRYHRPPWDQLTIFKGKGKYSAVTNNCIHFTKHYVFDQLLSRRKELKNFTENIPWLVKKWGKYHHVIFALPHLGRIFNKFCSIVALR